MGSQNLSVFVNSSERLKFRIAANVTDRDRTQSDIYFYTNPVGYHPVDSVAVYGSDPKKMFSNPKKAIKAMGATGLVSYRLNDNIRFDLTAGLQKSSAIITGMEIFFFAHTERVSNSQFFNLQTKIYDFDIHLDHAWGRDDIVKGLPGMSAGRSTTNLNVEYKKHWNNLMFNAGLAAVYNSLKENPAGSFYKGTQTLYSWSPNIHLDYQATEKLRLIAGIRLENNKIPTKPYLTWQLVGSYKFSENSILRAVYSRANRSPFMLDMNFDSSVAMKTNPTNTRWTDVYMEGDKKLKLVVADMVEAGYRQKIGKHILVTLELFHSQVSGYNAPVMKEFGAWIDFTDLDAAAVLAGKMPTVSYAKLYYNFQNIPEKQMQTGGTAGLGIVVDGLSFRLWGTLQQTTTQNHNINPATMKQMGDLLGADVYPYMVAIALGLPKPPMKYDKGNGYFLVTNDDISPNYVNTTSKSTPSFYGGYEVNWRFIKHFSLFSSGYTYSRHEFSDRLSDQTFPIHAKLLMNGKIAYHFQESNQLFLSVNNILNATDTEYGFLDRTGMQIVVGLNVKF
ncbi:MAG: TonB-dependent receptor [Bacteroidales bacterium]|nr:TonB-dependent receptor [Bacteroidales bacterium]